jgi:hypothetical protein
VEFDGFEGQPWRRGDVFGQGSDCLVGREQGAGVDRFGRSLILFDKKLALRAAPDVYLLKRQLNIAPHHPSTARQP